MTNDPSIPDNDESSLPSSDSHPVVTIAPVQSTGGLAARVEDLDDPYSAFPHVDLSDFPDEPSFYGMGIRQVVPEATWVFERWEGFTVFDSYLLYLNDMTNAVAADITFTNEERYVLNVPEHLVPRGDVLIRGRVYRVGSGTPSDSLTRSILVKTTRPGGNSRDPEPGQPGFHDGLTFSIEGFPEGSVLNPGNIGGGLWCVINFYEHMRKNDLIQLSWDGVDVFYRVTPADVLAGQARVFVDKAVILQGSLKGSVTIRFRVQDVVLNYSGGEKFQYSKSYLLKSELDPSLRGAPIFLVDDVEVYHVDFDTQSGSTFEVYVDLDRLVPAPNPSHRVTVTLFGTLADGVTQKTVDLPSVVDRNRGGEVIPVPADIVGAFIGSSFRVSYRWHTSTGTTVGQSGSIGVTVVGTPVEMPAVTVEPIEVGLIDPDIPCFVHIPDYTPHNAGYLETLIMQEVISGGGGAYYEETQLAGGQGGTRTISSATLQRFKGKANVEIYYQVDDGQPRILGGNAPLTIRQSLKLGVQVGERIANMPKAELEGATADNNINPADIVGPEALVTFPYTGTRNGDVLHYSFIGSGPNGSLTGTLDINPSTAGRPLKLPFSRDIVDNNNGFNLRITYSLYRAGPPELILRSEVLDLTVGIGVQLDRPIIDAASILPDRLNPMAVLAGAWVTVRFRPMRVSDHIFVDWLSIDGTGSTTVDVEGNATNEVKALIPARVIAQGIREGGNLIDVQYHFTRGVHPYQSTTVPLQLLALEGLPTPTIDGIGDSAILKVFDLVDTARTRVSTWPFIHENQRMWMTYTGTFEDNTPFVEHTYTANLVTTAGVNNGILPPTPTDKLRRLKDGSPLTIEFWASLAESVDKATAVRFGIRHHVVEAFAGTLPHPVIGGASGVGPDVTVDPLAIEHSTVVTVKYAGMDENDRITLNYIHADGTPHEATRNGLAGGQVAFDLTSANVLHRSVNTTVQLKYSVLRNGVGTPIPSEIQTVRVGAIASGNLPQPLLNDVTSGGTLVLNTITGNLMASLAKWRLSAMGQRVWLTCSSSGVADLHVLDGYVVTSPEVNSGLRNKAALRSWFTALPDNSPINVNCKIAFDGVNDEFKALPCPTTTYTVRAETPQELPYPRFANIASMTVTVTPQSHDNNTAFVRVAFTPMDSGMSIALLWGFPDGTYASIQGKSGNATGVVDFPISTQIMANSAGKQIKLSYVATINGVGVPSQTQVLNVLTISVAINPLIHNVANGGQLDVANLPATAKLTIARWPLQYSGMPVWMRFRCPGATPNPLVWWEGAIHYSSNGLEIGAPLAWLNTCPHGATVTAEFKVGYSTNVTEAQAVSFPVTTYSVKATPPLLDDTTTFNNFNRNGWNPFHSDVPIQVQQSGSEFFLVSPTGYYMGCRKVFANVGAGGFRVTVRYRNSKTHSTNYAWPTPGRLLEFPSRPSSAWITEVIGPIYCTGQNMNLALKFESGTTQIDSIRVQKISMKVEE
ncbi:YncE family protein [Pseudomonas canadensis]|uniref:YncE family protein n=1 Tax=Pseudomonas canadensis TaxID=915099 RepID=UPI0030CD0012